MTTATVPTRRVPPLGGFNLTFLALEMRRLLRNRRTVIFTLVLPVVFFLIFGTNRSYSNLPAGSGNVEAFVMISMAVYGAMLGTTATGAMVSVERAQGWSRQLRLTPLKPVAYIVVKVLTATTVGLASIAAVYTAGGFSGAHMPVSVWAETALIAWVGSLVFAAFGLFMGYLLPSENVMQILGPVLALLAFLGGLFVPLDQIGEPFRTIAQFTPMYGLNQLVHAPLVHDGLTWAAVLNLVVWAAVFTGGAAWRFRRDTARV
jgi:ABC-2 type transport system permease protein